jgi:hypothetical protein
MKARFRYLIAFVILALIAAVLTWKYTFRKTETSVASQKADVEITASELLQAFETNETTSNALYLDKVVRVTGTVDSFTEDSLGISVYLKEVDALAGIICSFDKSSIDISKIRKGSPLSIKGICTGYLMDVVLNRCSLESVTKK